MGPKTFSSVEREVGVSILSVVGTKDSSQRVAAAVELSGRHRIIGTQR